MSMLRTKGHGSSGSRSASCFGDRRTSATARQGVAALAALAMGGFGLIAGSSPAAASGGQIAPLVAAQGRVIAGQYVVVLKSGNKGADVARRHGARAAHTYTTALAGFAGPLNAQQLDAVRRDPAVSYVAPDETVSIVGKPTPPVSPRPTGPGVTPQTVQTGATWGIDRIDQRVRPLDGAYHYTTTGSGVRAYVIDTGIYAAHAQFGGRVTSGYTAIADGNGTNDCYGHGTHVSGTIGGSTYGVAKAVTLVPVRVLDCRGSGSYSGVLAGVDWVTYTHSGPSVANMSLGGGYFQPLNDALTNSIAQGVTYAVAAGNWGDNACNYSPASTPAALTVSATDNADTRPPFWANYGSCVDLFAPGVDITSAWIGSTTATNTISGTSMATPHVAGLAALYLQANPYATPAVVNSVLTTDAATGVVSNPGTGSPNRLARKWNSTLSGTGAGIYEPDGGSWTQSGTGYIQAWLYGTPGTDTDLYLQRWNGSSWVTVASSAGLTNIERIVYQASAGTYRFQVYAYSGGGTYDLWVTYPA